MHSLRFTAEISSNGVIKRDFTLGEVTGVLWSPASGSNHAALVLMGHGDGLHKKTPALLARAHRCVATHGYTVAAIGAAEHGNRPPKTHDEHARADLQNALAGGETERFTSISVRYVTALAERAVPEWQATLDALQQLPEIGTEAPIGYGGVSALGTAIGIPLTAVEPRISAAIFGGGLVVHESLIEAARWITVPVQLLLPWDDEHLDRQSALALFDAFASKEKTLYANPGNHRNVGWFGVDDSFLVRHLDAQRCRGGIPHLSKREWEVLRLVHDGHDNSEIARRLFISLATVRKHLEHIFDRTGIRRRTAAAALMMPHDGAAR